jgi:sugar/nucleoside kinase (ribokinase family)
MFHPPALFVSGAHIDATGLLDAAPIIGVSNPGRVVARAGGAGLNMASNAVALGLDSALAGPVGADTNGSWLRRVLAERGIGDHLVALADRATGTYTAIVAPDGEMVIGLADLAIYEAIDADWLFTHCGEAFEVSRLWCVSANLTPQTLGAIAGRAQGRTLAAATISPAKSVRLGAILERLDLLFTSHAEAQALSGLEGSGADLAQWLMQAGVGAGTLSAGPGPLVAWQDGAIWQLVPPVAPRIADVNGAGDAIGAVILAGLARGLAMPECARLAIAAAQWTLGSPEPFRAGLDWPGLEELAAAVEPAVRLR